MRPVSVGEAATDSEGFFPGIACVGEFQVEAARYRPPPSILRSSVSEWLRCRLLGGICSIRTELLHAQLPGAAVPLAPPPRPAIASPKRISLLCI